MGNNPELTKLNVLSPTETTHKVLKSRGEYMKLSEENKWEMFQYRMLQITVKPTMKTILPHATTSEDSHRNGVRENDSLLSTHFELSPEPSNPPSSYNPTPQENSPTNILASVACTLKSSDSGPSDPPSGLTPTPPHQQNCLNLTRPESGPSNPPSGFNPIQDPSALETLAKLADNLKKLKVEDVMVNCNGMKHINKDVPTTHVAKHKSHVARLENQARKFLRLEKVRTQKKYCGSPMGNCLLGEAAALAPQLSLFKLKFLIPSYNCIKL